jgi:hypothetical protein
MDDVTNVITLAVIGIFFVAFAFLLLREVSCWYFKINERLKVLQGIRDALKISTKSLPPNHPLRHPKDPPRPAENPPKNQP